MQKATGKPWTWLRTLDKAGAMEMPHKDIATLLHHNHGVGSWWCQMVTVGYEQARGMRFKHQVASGFSGNASRTIRATMKATFTAWTDEQVRAKWLPDAPMVIRKATPGKRIRLTWTHAPARGRGPTRDSIMEVNFWDKSAVGQTKTLVQLHEAKLCSPADVRKSKAFSGEALDRLRTVLEA